MFYEFMNLTEYKKLCKSCDEILTSKNSSFVTKAIPWLHVLNAHPTTQERYTNVWEENKKNNYISLYRSLGLFLRNLIAGGSSPRFVSSNHKIKKTDVLILSHLLNKDHLGREEDFYFGNMASELQKKDVSSQILLRDHVGLNYIKIRDSWGKKSTPRLFFTNRLSFLSELFILFRLTKEAAFLYISSYVQKDRILKNIYKTAAKAAFSFDSISAVRFSYQFEYLVSELQPKAIITTMEGHAFERLAFFAARRVNPRIKCFGYQHAVLFPHQHAIKRSLGSDYDPDIIFTAGNQTISTLLKGYRGKKVQIYNIGTHRSSCPETIYDLTKTGLESVCLVLPDGNITECLDLCSFAYKAAKSIPEIKFVIRLHPLNSVEMLILKNKVFKKLPPNLAFSNNDDIQNDFKMSKWALYRGSGSVIHSVMAGCRPIYVKISNNINMDPLFEISNGRKIIKDYIELKIIMRHDISLTTESFLDELEGLFKYCKEYFTPSNTQVLIDQLKNGN